VLPSVVALKKCGDDLLGGCRLGLVSKCCAGPYDLGQIPNDPGNRGRNSRRDRCEYKGIHDTSVQIGQEAAKNRSSSLTHKWHDQYKFGVNRLVKCSRQA
jgi:hypothetical protein